MELEVSELLRVAWSGRAWSIHRTVLFVLVRWRPDAVRVVSCRIQVLVLAQRHRLVVLPLADRCRACSLCYLVLIVVMVLWRGVNRLVPPIPRI